MFAISNLQLEYGSVAHDYIPYGNLVIRSTGFNLFDEQMELGVYNTSTGARQSNNTQLRSVTNIPVSASTNYYINVPYSSVTVGFVVALFYKMDGSYISYSSLASNGAVFTTPANAAYMTFYISTLYGTTYNNDICVNESDATRNGVYEPYQSHIAYIDLKGHELHGLDSTYYDQLDIDASGHAVLTKRTAITGFDAPWSLVNTNSNRTAIRTLSLDAVKYGQSALPAILSNMHVAHKYTDTFHDGYIGIYSSGYLFAGFDSSYTTLSSIIEAYPNLSITYPLDPAYWYTVDLGYVDLPQVTDGSTVNVAAEIQPIIGGTWWTKAGYSTGRLMQDTKNLQGTIDSPYTEVEWVESNGTQYVYLD